MRITIYLLSLLLFLGVLSCGQKETPQDTATTEVLTGNDTLSIPKSLNLKPNLRLTEQAQQGVENWKFYKDLTAAIDSLPATTLGGLKSNLENFAQIYNVQEEAEEAEISVTPPEVETNAINARLLVIETKLNVLKNFTSANKPDTALIAEKTGEIYNAFQDLKLQLNERFSSNLRDLLDEIKKENEEAAQKVDSIN